MFGAIVELKVFRRWCVGATRRRGVIRRSEVSLGVCGSWPRHLLRLRLPHSLLRKATDTSDDLVEGVARLVHSRRHPGVALQSLKVQPSIDTRLRQRGGMIRRSVDKEGQRAQNAFRFSWVCQQSRLSSWRVWNRTRVRVRVGNH